MNPYRRASLLLPGKKYFKVTKDKIKSFTQFKFWNLPKLKFMYLDRKYQKNIERKKTVTAPRKRQTYYPSCPWEHNFLKWAYFDDRLPILKTAH